MTRQNHKRGFNLIEAAIVLAVVGGVIGGIWVAAATVIENHKVNKTVEAVIIASQKLGETISFSDASLLPRSSTNYAHLTSYCISAKIFPDDFYSGNKIVTPFSGGVIPSGSGNGGSIVCNINPYLSGEDKIEIIVGVETKQLCRKMVRAITARFKNNNMLANVIIFDVDNQSSSLFTNWPLDGSQCNSAWMDTPLQIRLRFNFLRIN